jgi:hypothetical protein
VARDSAERAGWLPTAGVFFELVVSGQHCSDFDFTQTSCKVPPTTGTLMMLYSRSINTVISKK